MNSQNLKASVSFVGDGTTNKFYFGFDYINKQFVKVQIGNEGQSLTYPSDYTVDDRSVVLKDTPAVGVAIRVYRETSSDRIVEWADGAFIKASQMTLENLQQLHLIEEAQDYPILNSLSKYPDGINFNALGSRVVNVSDPKDPQDVVTKAYMESVQNGFVTANTILVQEATKQASAAKSSQEAAKTSETNAKKSETNSEISHQKAKKWAEAPDSPDGEVDTESATGKTQSSRTWALFSKSKAQEANTSATNAKTSENNAKSSETKAAVSATNAKTSETNAKTSERTASDSASASASSASAAATSATKAKTSEDNASSFADSAYTSVVKAQTWAESEGSPDGEDDSLSTTGKTKSAKGWAEQAKDYAGAINMSYIINTILPVGIIIEFTNDTDPNVLWVGTTWVKMDAGRVLVSDGTYTEGSDTYTYTLGDKGGEAKHQLTTKELVAHSHAVSIRHVNLQGSLSYTDNNSLTGGINTGVSGIISKKTAWGHYGGPASADGVTSRINIDASHGHDASIGNSGGSGAHENRQPYIVVNRWKRVA